MNKRKELLLSDPELYDRLKSYLISKKPVLGADSPFSEMLRRWQIAYSKERLRLLCRHKSQLE